MTATTEVTDEQPHVLLFPTTIPPYEHPLKLEYFICRDGRIIEPDNAPSLIIGDGRIDN